MGERSGVGLVELAILGALDARRAWPKRRPVHCLKVLLAMESEIGLAPGYAYQVLTDLVQPWKLPIPLIEGHGNRTWTRAYQHEDLHASLAALEAALPSRYQKA